ncbi:MAG: hypothetical protein ACKO38_07465 [Planctomycetota bacterium]
MICAECLTELSAFEEALEANPGRPIATEMLLEKIVARLESFAAWVAAIGGG